MSSDTMSAQPALKAAAHETLVASLRNAHALEKQVISVLQSQLKLLDDYPELHARLTKHVAETREQARRLESGLEACGASASVFKDALLSAMGMGQSSVQGFADDAVLKAMLADMMTEHLEIASYRTLIALADMAGKPELRPRLEETLREEEAMASWFDENLEAITRRFVEIKAAKERPAPVADHAAPEGEGSQTLWQTLESAETSPAHPGTRAKPSPGMTAGEPNATPEPETPRRENGQPPPAGAAPKPTNPAHRPQDT